MQHRWRIKIAEKTVFLSTAFLALLTAHWSQNTNWSIPAHLASLLCICLRVNIETSAFSLCLVSPSHKMIQKKKGGSIKQSSTSGTVNTVFYIEAATASMALRQQDDISLPINSFCVKVSVLLFFITLVLSKFSKYHPFNAQHVSWQHVRFTFLQRLLFSFTNMPS